MKKRFEGKSIVITGASSGLGKSLAIKAAAHGARLLVAARRLDRLESLATELGPDVEIHTLGLDLSQVDACETLVREAEKRLGGIDILILNAGQTASGPVSDSTMEDARSLMNVNYFGPLATIRAALPGMLARQTGHIAVISSYCAYAHLPMSGPYSASKAAVAALARVLSTELPPPLGVTVVYPGVIRTEMFERVSSTVPVMQRFERGGIEPDDAARKVLDAIRRKKLALYLTGPAVIMEGLMRLAPDTIDWTARRIFHRIPKKLLETSSDNH